MDMEQWARVRRRVLLDGQSKRPVMPGEGLHWEAHDDARLRVVFIKPIRNYSVVRDWVPRFVRLRIRHFSSPPRPTALP